MNQLKQEQLEGKYDDIKYWIKIWIEAEDENIVMGAGNPGKYLNLNVVFSRLETALLFFYYLLFYL